MIKRFYIYKVYKLIIEREILFKKLGSNLSQAPIQKIYSDRYNNTKAYIIE